MAHGPKASPENACGAVAQPCLLSGHPDSGSRQLSPVLLGQPQRGPSEVPRKARSHLVLPPTLCQVRGWASAPQALPPRLAMGSPGRAETPRAIQEPPRRHGCSWAGRCGSLMAFGAAPSSRRPSAPRQSTLFNPAEGNTSSFPSQHLFSVANPGNTRPFYLLRKEWITTTFLPSSFPLSGRLLAPLPTLLLKWQPLCCRHRGAAGALKQRPVSCSHLLRAIVSARPNNSTIVITTLCTNTNELVNRGPTKIKPL